MPLNRSHGKLRPEAPRPRDLTGPPAAATAGADRDPATGRFRPGNTASRRRKLLRVARQLPWLDPSRVEPWVAPYVEGARQHAYELSAELSAVGSLVSPLAEEVASARLVYRALLQLGLSGDHKALDAARAWLRESRQHALALEALARGAAEQARNQPTDPHARLLEAFGEAVPAPARPQEPTDPEPGGDAA